MIKLLATLALSDSGYKMPSSSLGLPSISGGYTSQRTNLMFVQDETLAGNGHFAIEIPFGDKKQKLCKQHFFISQEKGVTLKVTFSSMLG